MIAQIVVFSCKTDAQGKKDFAFRSAKIAKLSFANGNPNLFPSNYSTGQYSSFFSR